MPQDFIHVNVMRHGLTTNLLACTCNPSGMARAHPVQSLDNNDDLGINDVVVSSEPHGILNTKRGMGHTRRLDQYVDATFSALVTTNRLQRLPLQPCKHAQGELMSFKAGCYQSSKHHNNVLQATRVVPLVPA